jgi:syringomycin synthetase protein SyrE
VHLLGHSFGGWVAFELALRWVRAGREIASLTLVDTKAPDLVAKIPEYTHTQALRELVNILEQSAGRSLGLPMGEFEAVDPSTQQQMLHRGIVAAGLLPLRTTPSVLQGSIRHFASCLRTSFVPSQGWKGPMNLVLLDDPRLDAESNREAHELRVAQWSVWVQALTSWRGPGDHMSALKPPHVAPLAQWIRARAGTAYRGERHDVGVESLTAGTT